MRTAPCTRECAAGRCADTMEHMLWWHLSGQTGASMIDRRTFVSALVAALGPAPLAVLAQPARARRIGFLGNGNAATGASQTDAFRQGLRELGWIEGRNVTIEYRWADGRPEVLPNLVNEIVQSGVDVIVLSGPIAMQAARKATRTIPIVFVVLIDPVSMGLVQSLAHPGGNMTGLASQFEELITKQLQLLKEALPHLSRVALLHHSASAPSILAAAELAAKSLGLTIARLAVNNEAEFEDAFKAARNERAGAVHVLPSPYLGARRARLIALAASYRLPAFYELALYVRDGGLMSYGPSTNDLYGRSASYVDRILKGAHPGDLPIERPARFELVINRKTAAALGLTIPQTLLQRADEVIE
jgi:putative ABC transport system substrate-binding protein